MRRGRVNKGDVILAVILGACLLMFGGNEWNITHGFEQFTSSAWTCFGVVFGGELMAFAVKKAAEAMAEAKRPREPTEEEAKGA